jgi:hypothetical protein
MNIYNEISKLNITYYNAYTDDDIKHYFDRDIEYIDDEFTTPITRLFCRQDMNAPLGFAIGARCGDDSRVLNRLEYKEIVAGARTGPSVDDIRNGIDVELVNRALALAKLNHMNDRVWNFAIAPMGVEVRTVDNVAHTPELTDKIIYGFRGNHVLDTGIIFSPYKIYDTLKRNGRMYVFRYAVCDSLYESESYYSVENI